MLRVRDESMVTNLRIGFSINFLFYLSFEFLIGVVISGFLIILNVIKSLLPKPPRDLSGDVVLVCTLYKFTIYKFLIVQLSRFYN